MSVSPSAVLSDALRDASGDVSRPAFARTPRDPGLFLSLAPMDGVTDWVHRELASSLGGVSQCVTEFVRVLDQTVPAKVFYATHRSSPAAG